MISLNEWTKNAAFGESLLFLFVCKTLIAIGGVNLNKKNSIQSFTII